MASRRGRPHPHRGHKGHHRHSTSHRKPRTHASRKGRPHPHRGAHVPHPGARHPRPRHESPAQAAAARANLAKARARHPRGQQTPAQLAAERANLAKARAARRRGPRMVRAEDGTLVPASFYRHHAVRKRRARVAGHPARRRTARHPRTRHPRVKTAPHPRVHTAHAARVAGTRHAGAGRSHSASHTRRIPGLGGPRHHYNRHGLHKTTHWIAGHRSARHPHRARWAWTVRGARRRGWNWNRPRRSRAQW